MTKSRVHQDRSLIVTDTVMDLFNYDPAGYLVRRVTVSSRAKIGERAGWMGTDGYLRVTINGVKMMLHRAIWLFHNSTLPDEINHINAEKTDNRIENLRACTRLQQRQRMKLNRNNTSGYKGICWVNQSKRWRTQLFRNSKPFWTRFFRTKAEAIEAMTIQRNKLHGEFARLN